MSLLRYRSTRQLLLLLLSKRIKRILKISKNNALRKKLPLLKPSESLESKLKKRLRRLVKPKIGFSLKLLQNKNKRLTKLLLPLKRKLLKSKPEGPRKKLLMPKNKPNVKKLRLALMNEMKPIKKRLHLMPMILLMSVLTL